MFLVPPVRYFIAFNEHYVVLRALKMFAVIYVPVVTKRGPWMESCAAWKRSLVKFASHKWTEWQQRRYHDTMVVVNPYRNTLAPNEAHRGLIPFPILERVWGLSFRRASAILVNSLVTTPADMANCELEQRWTLFRNGHHDGCLFFLLLELSVWILVTTPNSWWAWWRESFVHAFKYNGDAQTVVAVAHIQTCGASVDRKQRNVDTEIAVITR